MTDNRTSRFQTSLAYLLLATILTSLWFTAMKPLVTHYTQRNEKITALQLRNQSILQQLLPEETGLTNDRRKQLNAFVERNSITAKTPEIGGSFLQKRLVDILENNSTNPKSALVTTNPKEMSVAVSVQFDSTLNHLGDILIDLAQSSTIHIS